MPIVTDQWETRRFLETLREHRVAVPAFCTENAWTTEAALAATRRAGERFGIAQPPVVVAFTAAYPGRSNLGNYWACGDMRLGLRGALGDLEVLTSPGSPYAACRVFTHLDHGVPDEDAWLLEEELDRFAMVMFDGSSLPPSENIARTAGYVARFGQEVIVEGAVGELSDASRGEGALPLTTPEQAQRFLEETGCDLIVPNVGTEHRAAEAGRAAYHAERAREIAQVVGPRLVLHGTSCMGRADLSSLPGDGFVKVNVWTIIEKTGGGALAEYALRSAGSLMERARVEELVAEGLLGEGVLSPARVEDDWGGSIGPDLARFPLIEFRRRWVGAVGGMLEHYFEMFGYERLPKQPPQVA
jgi:fructose-bisphosphate aldolase class II